MNAVCPWVQWCNKINGYKELSAASTSCRYMNEEPTPNGYCRVEFERHGDLYVRVDADTVKPIHNPFDDIPKFVKVTKLKNGEYRLRK